MASRQLLEDAAVELFLEQGYSATTVDHIAKRAGVSRNTFFNYFPAKSDVLWSEVDRAIETLRGECAQPAGALGPVAAARAAIMRVVDTVGNDRVPLALTQFDLIGAQEEIESSGLMRVGTVSDVLSGYVQRNAAGSGVTELRCVTAASALAAAIASAWMAWARAGIGRAPLSGFATEAFDLVFAGLDGFDATR